MVKMQDLRCIHAGLAASSLLRFNGLIAAIPERARHAFNIFWRGEPYGDQNDKN
jgi:hypothetical protein